MASSTTLQALERLRTDLPLFAERCLKIRGKSGAIVPFTLNRAQRHVHERLEAQRARTGKVRALILKARQQGFSTYIGARFYHRASLNRGQRVFILTHERAASDNLFGMVDDNNADRYGGLFAGMIADINVQEARDAARGPLAGSAGAVVV